MRRSLQKLAVPKQPSDHPFPLVAQGEKDTVKHPQWDDDIIVIRFYGQSSLDIPILNDHFAFLYSIKGSGTANMDNFGFNLSTDHLYLVKPNLLPVLTGQSVDFQCYLLLFKRTFLMEALAHEPLMENLVAAGFEEPLICKLDKRSSPVFHHLFKRLDQEYHSRQLFHDKMLKLLFIELLFEASRTRVYVSSDTLKLPSRQHQLVYQFRKLVDEHFLTKRTVQEYADSLFVTAKHLSEVVKAITGTTALHIIHSRLFQEAKYWLSTSALTIKEIAMKLNFDTSSHFSRFFKHFAGYNPTEFQRIYLLA